MGLLSSVQKTIGLAISLVMGLLICFYFIMYSAPGDVKEILGVLIGLAMGLPIGFYLFIYSEPEDVKDPVVKPLHELDDARLQDLMPEIPFWVKKPDYDRIDWLNKIIFHMWPFLDKAICSMIRSTTKPIFDEYIGKFKINSIEFEKLTLGNLPPILHGLKVCETDEKELVMEPAFYFAGNPNIVVVVTIASVRIKLQLVDVQIFAALRVTLRPLLSIIPCFEKVVASLMEEPHLDFGLKILGGDFMAIPGLHHYVQETIKKEIMQLCMWPKFFQMPMLEESWIPKKKHVGILHVKVKKAMNLMKMDWFGLSDPYVKLSLSGDTLPSEETAIKKKTLNPEWNENFMLIVNDPQSQLLNINVYDWDKGSGHDRLGMHVYPLKWLEANEIREVKLDLVQRDDAIHPGKGKQRGHIVLELSYTVFMEDVDTLGRRLNSSTDTDTQISAISSAKSPGGAGLLAVSVHGAEYVEGAHHTNPYALILFKGERRKSKSARKTHSPRWDEEFQFKLDEPPLEDLIRIEIMSKRTRIGFLPKESLGYVDINLYDVVNNGRINHKFHLINSRNGIIHVELEWKPVREPVHHDPPHQSIKS